MADEIDNEVTEDPKLVCTCNDGEFVTEVCPACIAKKGLIPKVIEVNDGHLLSSNPVTITGHLFQCPACQENTILVNSGYIPKVCPGCKSELAILSKTFSDYVRKESNSLNATEIAIGNFGSRTMQKG